jgi:putative ABC transport system permease protein
LSRVVPVKWRQTALSDLREEAARSDGRSPIWITRHLLAIGIRLRRRTLRDALPSSTGVFTGFQRDMVAAVRLLRRSPGSTMIAIGTLAVSVAAVVVVTAILQRTVLNPLPFSNVDRLTAIWRVDPATPQNWLNTTAGDFVEWRRGAESFESLVAAQNISMTFTGFADGGAPLMRRVTHGWFETLGVSPVLGRTFSRDEDVANGPPVAMLSYATWQQRFAARQDVVGTSVELDSRAYTIVGVLPSTYYNPVFRLVDEPQVFLPLGLADAGESRAATNLLAVGRLAPGRTLDDAHAEIARMADAQAQAYPDTNRQFRAIVQPLDEQLVRPVRTPLALLLVAVTALLVAACGNVANLHLVRALGRRQEHAVQQALGASRLRLFLQQLVEAMMIAGVSGVIAVGLAAVAGPAVQQLAPPGFLAPQIAFELTPAALAMAVLITFAAGLLSSIPALLTSLRRLVGTELSAGAVRSVGTRERRRWASGLVAAEITVAVVLLGGAGLTVLGMDALLSASHGFDERGALTFRVSTRGPEFSQPESRYLFFERVLEEFRRVPGVSAAGGANALPIFDQFNERPAFRVDVADRPAPGLEPRVSLLPVTDGFFDAMGMTVEDGRDLDITDRMNTPNVTVLSRTAATRLFGSDRAIGRSIALIEGTRERRVEVVGVVNDVRSSTDPTRYTTVAYTPIRQGPAPPSFGFVLRSPETPAVVSQQAQAAVARVNRSMPVYLARPLDQVAASLVATSRFTSALLTTFAFLGVALVASGLYGTIAHLVAERRREMGVRVALGATRMSVLRLVLTDGLRPALMGLALGWVGALGFGQVIARVVAGTPAFQWSLFLALPAGLFGLCALASLVPALRATRVDPTTALRAE